MKIQKEYDKIYSFFKTTTKPYDDLDWNGKILNLWLKDNLIETYSYDDLKEIGVFD